MRKKERKLIITFYTTADAMAMEEVCARQHVQGRLIPVPRTISAGCGLAWCTEPKQEANLRHVMEQAGIREEEIQECMI